MFIDQAKISVIAGNGGHGVVSFRREKFVPKGGPDGGDGGKGGDIVFQADSNLHTLLDFRYKRIFKANSGKHGQGSKKSGKGGENLIIRVPCGTIIKDRETGDVLADIVKNGEKKIIAKGGKGGRGNWHFSTPTQQAPRQAEKGRTGESREILLELKLIADVGLVGFPNAGKSTLLSRLSAARPKIADYPFTTLSPNLGIVQFKENLSFVMADIPGLIEGAHSGKGLGHKFLRHIERTKMLIFLIDRTSPDVYNDFVVLSNELEQYNLELMSRPIILVITKKDISQDLEVEQQEKLQKAGFPLLEISSVTGEGLEKLKEKIWELLEDVREQE